MLFDHFLAITNLSPNSIFLKRGRNKHCLDSFSWDEHFFIDHSISRWKPNKVNKITLKVEREKVARVCFEIDLN